jgi:cytochrome b561
MLIKNTTTQYGLVAILFHWLMALLVVLMLCLGLYMVTLPIGVTKLKLYGWHKQIGALILGLVFLRLFWRFVNIVPIFPAHMPNWQRFAARSVHGLLYFFLFALPLTGWLLSSAAGLSVSFFGLFLLPDLISPDENLRHLLTTMHNCLAFTLIAVLFLHIAGALQHHFIDKDDILLRMLP